jgi:hypothetical protein
MNYIDLKSEGDIVESMILSDLYFCEDLCYIENVLLVVVKLDLPV